jgi:hypothetical protein
MIFCVLILMTVAMATGTLADNNSAPVRLHDERQQTTKPPKIHPPSCHMLIMYLGWCMSCTPPQNFKFNKNNIINTSNNTIYNATKNDHQQQHNAFCTLNNQNKYLWLTYINASQQLLYNICCDRPTGFSYPPWSQNQTQLHIPLCNNNFFLNVTKLTAHKSILSNHYNISPAISLRQYHNKHTTNWTVRGRQGSPYQSLLHQP